MFTAPDGRHYQRIYHYHIRKTGGTSLNWAFFRSAGGDAEEVYSRLNCEHQAEVNGFRFAAWNRGLLQAGEYDYGFSHIPMHRIDLPPGTFAFTVLRDPVKRVLSHYKMLLQMRDKTPDHPGFKQEKHLIESGFDGFLEHINPDELMRQLSMFSAKMDLDEALSNISRCDLVMELDSLKEGVAELGRRTGCAVVYSHDRKTKVEFEPDDEQMARLREMLKPEYEFYEQACRTIVFGHEEKTEQTNKVNSSAPRLNLRKSFSVPVAVVAYNRPKHTEQVLSGLKEYGVDRLYLFSDAPRNEKDEEAVGAVRELFQSVNWADTEVIERKDNLGLKNSIIKAAGYVFERHKTMLLLEDDVVPLPTMFPFIEAGLERYENVSEVAGVSGFGPPLPEAFLGGYPYDAYFFHRMSSWAWATWRSRWKQYNPDLAALMKEVLRRRTDLTLGGSNVIDYTLAALKGKDIWTPNWILTMAMNNQLFVYPTHSHINNIGLDGSGMNAGKTDRYRTSRHDFGECRFPDDLEIAAEVCELFYGTHGRPAVEPGDKSGTYPVVRWTDKKRSEPIEQPTDVERIRDAMKRIEGHDYAGALEQLEALNGASDRLQNVHLMRALCYLNLGQPQNAKTAVQRELKLFPDNREAEAFRQALDVKEMSGQESAVDSDPVVDNDSVHSAVLRPSVSTQTAAIRDQGEAAVATAVADSVEQSMERARREMESGSLEAAFQTIHRAKALKKNVRGLDYQRAEIFLKMNRPADAQEALREELRLFPDHQAAQKLAAEIGADRFTGKVPDDPEFLDLLGKIRPYTMLTELRLYNLYRMARKACEEDLPGNFVECGVAGGGATALIAAVVKRYSRRPRKVFAFDTFDGMPEPTEKDRQIRSGIGAEESGWGTGTCAAPVDNVHQICRELGAEDLLVTVPGLFDATLPASRSEIQRIALLHADADWYASQLSIFTHLYDLLVPNGFVQVDDYGYWSGSREAVDEFQQSRGLKFTMREIDGSGVWFRLP